MSESSEAAAPPLDATLHRQPLADSVELKRQAAALRNVQNAIVLVPRIEGHLQVYGLALDALDHVHGWVVENTNLDLTGDSRQAAVWLVGGRCIGFMRAALALLADGFAADTTPMLRSVHEATRLLNTLADPDEPDLLRRWLADDWVRPKQTRAAGERMRDRLRKQMEAAKAEAEAEGDHKRAAEIAGGLRSDVMRPGDHLRGASEQIYDVLSKIEHTRRSGLGDAVSVERREMVTAPHPSPRVRADYVEYAGHVVEEVVRSVGDMLAHFFGPGWYGEQVVPLLRSLADVRAAAPLDR
jgi:hypothetical protein